MYFTNSVNDRAIKRYIDIRVRRTMIDFINQENSPLFEISMSAVALGIAVIVAKVIGKISAIRSEREIINKIRSGEYSEQAFVEGFKQEALRRIILEDEPVFLDREVFDEDQLKFNRSELAKNKQQLKRCRTVKDLLKIYPNEPVLIRMDRLFKKAISK